MKYAIVYSSKTGNTKLLADALLRALPQKDCVYYGEPNAAALLADRLYIGFWTDKGSADTIAAEFMKTVFEKDVFLFGTAGFGGEASYFERIVKNAVKNLDTGNRVIGTYMCQGKMPVSVRERYEKMLAAPVPVPNVKGMIENFDKALTHPDEADVDALIQKIKCLE